MATNTTVVQRGTLRVKYRPHFTPTTTNIDKLVLVREAACKSVEASIAVLEPLSARPDVNTGMIRELAYTILRLHFKLPPLTAGALPQVGTPVVTSTPTSTRVSVRLESAGIEATAQGRPVASRPGLCKAAL